MGVKKFLRFFMVVLCIAMAAIVPFPIRFTRKDNLPAYRIEQIDEKEEDEEDDAYQAFS